MIALIDGDAILYRCAASVKEDEPEEIALVRTDQLLRQILTTTQAESYRLFVKHEKNFRNVIYPEYKANRTQPKPVHLEACYQFARDEWNAENQIHLEADDLLGIYQTEDSIICGIDKDLLMIPGKHYNFVKEVFTDVEYEDGLRHFYKQALIGDRADNIVGVSQIGPVKAAKIVDHLQTEQEMFDAVFACYDDPTRLITNLQCLYILQEENNSWVSRQNLTLPEECEPAVDLLLNSMKSLNLTT